MSPQVEAAIIAGSVGVVTLIGTLAAQVYSIHRTSRETAKTRKQQSDQLDTTLAAQREQLDTTLAAQREQLDTTLAAQREQLAATLADQREQLGKTLAQQRDRALNERFATAADRLGSDKPPAVRLAGVYAMAGLADDWEENRQACVDVLCAYLRLPYDPDPGDAKPVEQAAYRANREVRHTVIRLIRDHLRPKVKDPAKSWSSLNLDFTGAVFDGGKFNDAIFAGEIVRFGDATFASGEVRFRRVLFRCRRVDFADAEFSGGQVDFLGAQFSSGQVDFRRAQFSGSLVGFRGAQFSGSLVGFRGAQFSGGRVDFGRAQFSGSLLRFADAEFSGSQVSFRGAEFSGGTIDLQDSRGSHPPVFDPDGPPPAVVTLPAAATPGRPDSPGADTTR